MSNVQSSTGGSTPLSSDESISQSSSTTTFPGTLPEGATFDGTKITYSNGVTFDGTTITLPTGETTVLPEGYTFDGEKITNPEGGEFDVFETLEQVPLPDVDGNGKYTFGETFFWGYTDSLLNGGPAGEGLTNKQKVSYAWLLYDLGKEMLENDILDSDILEAIKSKKGPGSYNDLNSETEMGILARLANPDLVVNPGTGQDPPAGEAPPPAP